MNTPLVIDLVSHPTVEEVSSWFPRRAPKADSKISRSRRGPRARRNRREDADDARRHRDDVERDGRHARAGHLAVLGAASVRMQGMRGRYTRFLSDGLPLFGEVGGLGLLQIPPMDLAQVEVIKGVASSLYGAGAMGGVVNLVSRRPAKRRAGTPAQPVDARRHRAVGLVCRPARSALGHDVSWRRALAGAHGRRRRSLVRPARLLARGRAPAPVLGRRRRPLVLRHGRLHRRRTPRRHAPDVALPAPAYRTSKRSTRAAGTPARSGSRCSAALRGERAGGVVATAACHQFGDIVERDRHTTASPKPRCAARLAATPGSPAPRSSDAYRPIDVPQFLRVHGARRVRPGRHRRRVVAVDERERAARPSQRVRHVLQPAPGRPAAIGCVEQPRLGRHGLLRPLGADRRDRSRGPDPPLDSSRLRAEQGRSASFDITRTRRPVLVDRHAVRIAGAHPIHVERSDRPRAHATRRSRRQHGAELLGTFGTSRLR